MDLCNVNDFRLAINNPEAYLNELQDICADTTTLTRTTHFVECRALLHRRDVMLYAPITPQAIALAQHAAKCFGDGANELFTQTIYPNELHCTLLDHPPCAIVLEYIPSGITLKEAIYTHCCDTLLEGAADLEQRLRDANVSHNHLTPQNIIIDKQGVWHPIRQYYTTAGVGGDIEGFELLREEIRRDSLPPATHNIVPSEQLLDPIFEGRRMVCREGGVGFENEDGDIVIACQYLRAENFQENRATVMSHDKHMGLIDKDGNYIIPMLYNIVEYNVDTGNSWVRNSHQWALFSYSGVQITDWMDRDMITEEI
ncbi:MAG: WG repeat-containing protein [Alistipes sp.]|nr:WG repeat-containing protein [Alistipes sp.]